jgi:hypothetical protein
LADGGSVKQGAKDAAIEGLEQVAIDRAINLGEGGGEVALIFEDNNGNGWLIELLADCGQGSGGPLSVSGGDNDQAGRCGGELR